MSFTPKQDIPVFFCGLVLFLAGLAGAPAAVVSLAWGRSTDTNAVGYHIYYGTVSHGYTNLVDAGNATSITLSGLVPGVTYFFAATTYDSVANESGFSDETSYVMPMVATATLTAPINSNGQFVFTINGSADQPNGQYVVQASVDLIHWICVQTNAAPFVFTDPNPAGFHQRFFRVFNLTP